MRSVLQKLVARIKTLQKFRSGRYWENRYAAGGTSGAGSYGELAQFKARVLNELVVTEGIRSVIEFGCGDGNQLSLAEYPVYSGLDVSLTAVQTCAKRFSSDRTKSFFLYSPEGFYDNGGILRADLALSLDVIYHLVEDAVYAKYLQHLFSSAGRLVVIYSSNYEGPISRHERPRQFTNYVSQHFPAWKLESVIQNEHPYVAATEQGSQADFYIYRLGTSVSTVTIGGDRQ